jgi:hypothetical protein
MQEFLGALGLAWPRLLLYPGGLSALGLVWLLTRLSPRPRLPARSLWPGPGDFSAVPPLLAISLMPLPYAVPFPYGLDLIVALALLNGPLWLLRSHHPPPTTHHPTILFVLAGLAMAQGAGGWRLDGLLGWATRPAPLDRALLLLGSLGWLIAALRIESPDPHGRDLGALLRLIGHLLIAGLPWLGLLYAASTVW